MVIKDKCLTTRFTAKSEDGHEFHLLVYTEILDVGIFQDPSATVEGAINVVTSEGQKVNRIDDLNYEIVELELKVKKVD